MNPDILHLFTSIWALLEVPLEASVQETTTSLSNYVQGPFKAWVIVYLMGTAAIAMYGNGDAAFYQFFRNMFRAAFVYSIISNIDVYNNFITAPLLHGVPDGIMRALNAGGDQFGPEQFDKLIVKSFVAGVEVFRNIPWLSFKGLALSMAVLVYWIVSAASITFTFAVYLAAHAAAAILVAVGPLFVIMRMFPATGSLFSGWLSTTLSAVVVQIMVVILLSMVIRMEESRMVLMSTIGDSGGTTGDNVITYMLIMIGMMMIFAIGGFLAWKISGIAASMTRGMYWAAEHVVGARAAQIGSLLSGGGGRIMQPIGAGSASAAHRSYSFQRPPGAAI